MRKLIALLLFCLVMVSSASAQTIPDQRPMKGNLHTRGLNIATFLRNGVNVQSFGAIADGKTDNTLAFNAAYATGFPVYVPQSTGCFAVNNLTVPSNSVTFGDTGPWYSSTTGSRSCITGTASATQILNVNGNSQQIIANLDIIGSVTGSFTQAIQCISGGSTDMTVSYISVRYCGNGGLGDGTNQTKVLNSIASVYYGNGQQNGFAGIENIVDSHIVAGSITSNYYGIDFPSGSNDNDIDGVKIEFNTHYGENFQSNSQKNVTRGGICDNNYFGCQQYGGAINTSTIGQHWRRNGRGANGSTFNYAQNNHVYFNGGASHITFSGIVTETDLNDGGGGTLGPPYVYTFNATTDSYITFGDSDFTGNTSGPNATANVPSNWTVKNVQGLTSISLGEQDLTGELILSPLATPAAPTITTSGTSGAATWTYKVVAFTSSGYQTAASAGGSTTTGNATLTGGNFNIVTITPVTGAMYYQIYRTAVGTSPTTTGKIGTVYAGTTVFNDTGVAGDSSTASTVNNTGSLSVGTSGTPTCGTGCSSITTGATNYRGSATSGTLAASVGVNWSATLPYTPYCVCTSTATTATTGCTPSNTALTINLSTGLTGDVITWICTP